MYFLLSDVLTSEYIHSVYTEAQIFVLMNGHDHREENNKFAQTALEWNVLARKKSLCVC